MKRLSERQQAFVIWMVRSRNGAKAAREAGYNPDRAKQQAHRLLNHKNFRHVQEAYKKLKEDRRAREALEHDDLRDFLISRTHMDGARVYDVVQSGNLNDLDEADKRHITSISVQEFESEHGQSSTKTTVNFSNPMEAAKLLAKSNGFCERENDGLGDLERAEARESVKGKLASLAARLKERVSGGSDGQGDSGA